MDFESHGNSNRWHADMELGFDDDERRPLVRNSHEFVNSIDHDLFEQSSSTTQNESQFLFTVPRNKDSFKRLLGMLTLAAIAFGSIAFVGTSILKSNRHMSEVAALEVAAKGNVPRVTFLNERAFQALKEGSVASIESITDVYVEGKMFSCSDEHITGHCKFKNETVLHEPRELYGDWKNPIIYSTDDRKFQIVEYKDESWMCPSQHITELSCREGVTLRKMCNKGEYNKEVIDPKTNQVYFICGKCPVGHYQNDNNFMGTQCKNCPGGTWVDFEGAAEFDRCKRKEEYKNAHAKDMPLEAEIPDVSQHPRQHVSNDSSSQNPEAAASKLNVKDDHIFRSAESKVTNAGTVFEVKDKKRVGVRTVTNAGTIVEAKEIEV